MTTSTPQSWKVTLDAPVTLLLVAAAAVLVLVPGSTALLRLDPMGPTAFFNPRWYLGVVGHVLAHQNFAHFIGNASLFLLLAPGWSAALARWGLRSCSVCSLRSRV